MNTLSPDYVRDFTPIGQEDKGWDIPGFNKWRRDYLNGSNNGFHPVVFFPEFAAFWYSGFGKISRDSEGWVYEIEFKKMVRKDEMGSM